MNAIYIYIHIQLSYWVSSINIMQLELLTYVLSFCCNYNKQLLLIISLIMLFNECYQKDSQFSDSHAFLFILAMLSDKKHTIIKIKLS